MALLLGSVVRLVVVVAEAEIVVVVTVVVLGGVWGRRLCASGDFLLPMGVALLLILVVAANDKSQSGGETDRLVDIAVLVI